MLSNLNFNFNIKKVLKNLAILVKKSLLELIFLLINIIINIFIYYVILIGIIYIVSIIINYLFLIIGSGYITFLKILRLIFIAIMIIKLGVIVLNYKQKSSVSSFCFSHYFYDVDSNSLKYSIIQNNSVLYKFEQSLIYYRILILFYSLTLVILISSLFNDLQFSYLLKVILLVSILYKLLTTLYYCYIIYSSNLSSMPLYYYNSDLKFYKNLYISIIYNFLNNLNFLAKYGYYLIVIFISFYFSIMFIVNYNFIWLDKIIICLKKLSLINVVYCQPINLSPTSSSSLSPFKILSPYPTVPFTPFTPGMEPDIALATTYSFWLEHGYPMNIFQTVFYEDNFTGPVIDRSYYSSSYIRVLFWSTYYSKLSICGFYGIMVFTRDIFSFINPFIMYYNGLNPMIHNWHCYLNEFNKALFFKIPRGDLTFSEPLLRSIRFDKLPYFIQRGNKQILSEGVLMGDKNILLPKNSYANFNYIPDVD